MPTFLKQHAACLMATLAFWPIGRWYVIRLSQSPDERWGLVALILAALFVMNQPQKTPRIVNDTSVYAHASGLLLLYAALFHFIPPLIRAGIAVTTLTRLLSSFYLGRKFHVGLWLLLILALPIIPSLQFYLGYPLRVLVAQIARPIIQLTGFPVIRDGAGFYFSGESLWIDAPCSGIKMLWAGLLLADSYACILQLSAGRTVLALILAGCATILANSFRAAALFLSESHILAVPAWFHQGSGVVIFGAMAIGLIFIINSIERGKMSR
jgi:exosortase